VVRKVAQNVSGDPGPNNNAQPPHLLQSLKQVDVAKFAVFELPKMPWLAEDVKSGAQNVRPRKLEPPCQGGCLPDNGYSNLNRKYPA
jgi:hypothetical protein